MARLWHAGAEIDGGTIALASPLNTGPDGSGFGFSGVTQDTVVFRSGFASWKCDSGAGNASQQIGSPLMVPSTFIAANSPYFFRGYLRIVSAPTTAVTILGFGGSNLAVVRMRTDGGIELLVNSVVQGSPSASLSDSSWHRFEMSQTYVGTNLTAAELRLDGVTVSTFSGTQAGVGGGVNWGWGATDGSTPGANKVINFDDFALNDSTGASNNSWCGDGAVVLLTPQADSAVGTGWTDDGLSINPKAGSVRSTPPRGIADTTAGGGGHQIRNATSNANVNYDATMLTYAAAGVTVFDQVNALYMCVATGAPVTTSAKQGTFGIVSNPTVANVALDATGTAGAFWGGATAGTYGAGWKWSVAAIQNLLPVTIGTAPVARITQVTSSTRIAMCCFMGIYVDYSDMTDQKPVMFDPIPFMGR